MAINRNTIQLSPGAAAVMQSQRMARRPAHTFNLKVRPWQIQPFLIAPVLPGETMQNALLQARVVTDPVNSPLMGWFAEFYLFYVKHRDLSEREDFTKMVLEYGYDMSGTHTAASAWTYHNAGIDWVSKCLDRVVDEYFRDEGDAPSDFVIDGVPIAKVDIKSWLDSATDETVLTEGGNLPDDADNATMEDLDLMQRQYEFMKSMQLTNMSYEDFLRTYGVRLGREEPHKPELIRYVREWTYPTNTINPDGGAPSSAASWSIAERADKDRFFKEPGFIFGVQVVRPKIFLGRQKEAAVHMLNDALAWLPAVLADDPATSLKVFANNQGPLAGNVTNGYWVDVRDLFMHGDQFLNHADAAWTNFAAMPTTGLRWKYAAKTDAEKMFRDQETPGDGDSKQWIRTDGICTFNILSVQKDYT